MENPTVTTEINFDDASEVLDETNVVQLISPIFFTKISELLKSKENSSSVLDEKLFDNSTQRPIKREAFKRVMKEIKDVNNDFFNLRTIIIPDPDDKINVFYYLMIPNDGAYCHLPLIGRIIITDKYPENPPIFHMLTKTERFNVDTYRYNALRNNSNSSMCFDILKDKVGDNVYHQAYSSWNEDFTLSAVFSAIMQSIVSLKVPQMNGKEQNEFITMEKLNKCYKNVNDIVKCYLKYVAEIPTIPANLPIKIVATPLTFPNTMTVNNEEQQFVSEAITLQTETSYVCGVNLEELTANYVFSVILTNNINDLVGKKAETILFRNGVTASAARKRVNGSIEWFYHGKPLNQGKLKLIVTISNRELTFCYNDLTTNDKWVIHGDYPLFLLDREHGGNLYNKKFYLVLYFKRKSGNNTINVHNLNPQTGLVHKKN